MAVRAVVRETAEPAERGTCNGMPCPADSGQGGADGATTCGAVKCQGGERCCEVPAGPNQECTPTCIAGPCPGIACHVSTDGGGSTDAAGSLTWQVTCGDPVCRIDPGPDSGLPSCSSDQTQGNPCTSAGEQCDPMLGCGQKLQCADHRLNTNCPIFVAVNSSKTFTM